MVLTRSNKVPELLSLSLLRWSASQNSIVELGPGSRRSDTLTRVVAHRPIDSGEEITYDYIIDCHGGDVWQCSCGSSRCRGTIVSSFFELPVELQLEYLPLLNEWFIEEHREKVEALRNFIAAG